MAGSPRASSTPKFTLKCRGPIRDEDTVISPFETKNYDRRSFSESESPYYNKDQLDESNQLKPNQEEQMEKQTPENVDKPDTLQNDEEESNNLLESLQEHIQSTETFHHDHHRHSRSPDVYMDEPVGINYIIAVALGILIAVLIGLIILPQSGSESVCKFKPILHPSVGFMLKQQFPSQEEDFGITIQVLIEDIQNYEQPKSVIFLYEDSSAETLNKILKKIAGEAVCRITSCCEHPLEVQPNNLTTVTDYGRIISKYKGTLEKSGVMIVRNLEKIPGSSAQAFHALCDEYNPVVKKALFLFTLHVPELPIKKTNDYARNYLKSKWTELDETKFAPLFTRITSGFVTSVAKENVDL